MRLRAGLLWASAVLQAGAVSAQALIYTSEVNAPLSNGLPPSISPITARLLLAQRLGLSQYHSLEDADESTLEVLNDYGGRQGQVFEDEEQIRGAEKLLLIVDGVSNPQDIFDSSTTPAISIDHPPSSFQNEELILNLLEEEQHSRATKGSLVIRRLDAPGVRGGYSTSRTSQSDDSFDSHKPQLSQITHLYKSAAIAGHDRSLILHVTTLQGLKPKDGARYTSVLSDLKSLISSFHKSNSQTSSTIILMPATTKPAKRSSTSPYGTFTHPLSIRQQHQPESPLTTPSSPSANPPSAPPPHLASTSPLPHGILPICHPTLDSAIIATNNCSSHGTTYKKSSGEPDCYACKCSKTVLSVEGGGSKTVYWGGSACQKKDISVPFFLLAGLSVLLVGAVTWGVGLLMSIGQEELPSVIGAGVTGPRAQK